MDLREVGCDSGDWINLAQNRVQWRVYVRMVLNLRVPLKPINYVIKLNPWLYSPEEPRSTEAVAARWQHSGPCGQQSAYPSTLISVFLIGFRYFSFKQLPKLSLRGWVDPVPNPILPEKFPGYNRESNPGPLGWQSDVLTTTHPLENM